MRSPPRRPDAVPRDRLPLLIGTEDPTLVKRVPSTSTTTASTRCPEGDTSSACEKYTSSSSTTTMPIVLGAVIPIVCAIIVLFYLHRRNVKRLRQEDANDKHKSLDFGLDLEPRAGSKPMTQAEKGSNLHAKGMSLDIGPSPYLLPPGLHGSRESLHSLSRSMLGDDDKYRHASSFVGDNASVRSQPRVFHDDMSAFSRSQSKASLRGDDMNQGLLYNAQRISRSSPPLYNAPSDGGSLHSPPGQGNGQDMGFQLNLPRSLSPVHIPGVSSSRGTSPAPGGHADGSTSEAHHGHLPQQPPKNAVDPSLELHLDTREQQSRPVPEALPTNLDSTAPSNQSPSMPTPRISLPVSDAASDYGDDRKSYPEIPAVNVYGVEDTQKRDAAPNHAAAPAIPEEPLQSQNQSLDVRRDTRRFTLGLRPLPPDDPSDNPEQRANRIRSFYKEYFDESKTGRETIYEDYGPEYFQDDGHDGYVYDPTTGDYYDAVPAPYAEPVNRRAMTPPPRAPPRFQGAARHMASGSMGGAGDRFNYPGPRAFSSASHRLPGPRAPRKPMPPPSPLQVLPSPHLLKDDSFMMAADYAPGMNFKDKREGRAETPLGGLRPYTPVAPARTPLASAFDELAAIPSPHALRKSGTFDNLDFAPPPRFKNAETASDAGSIHSNRTGISAAHLHNIRTGAYRVSRLPPETVGTAQGPLTSANANGGTPAPTTAEPTPTAPTTSSTTSSTTSTTSIPTEPSTTSTTSSTSTSSTSSTTTAQTTQTTSSETSRTPETVVTSISTAPPTNTAPTTIYVTSTESTSQTLPTGNSANGVTTTSSGSSATASSTGASSGGSGLSAGGTIAVAVVVPVVSVALIILAALYFWRKWKAKKAAEEERRKEVEEYGYNPNNDPTLPPIMAGAAYEPKEDTSGYRGWGTTSAGRKASTNLSSGAGAGLAMSEGESAPGYHHAATPSDGTIQFSEGQIPETEPIGVLGAAPPAANNRTTDIHRGPSNASSAYSAANRSEASEESHMSATHPNAAFYEDNPYYSDMQGQYGAYGDGPYVPNQPVIRDVQARRNTRIENPAVFPRQGNAGIAQNF
ncbi:hypothetical protein CNMCM5793_001671 [Aspergillus hiratsukae]|uniref:Uncharacterized protein n=1 Tax=Aspergillus hiratsukae TaxID=1194566 RepID=A0A8H6PM80_9EURO|nr:hypothetical protein CNMCM5793_001671 [Aspergillus hiratsukae]KAF7156576.1 hypothetical protein CNMCM6106_000608 [Aspergillus hiratsukae]